MPIDRTTRTINSAERRVLQHKLARVQLRLKKAAGRISIFGLIVLAVLWAPTLYLTRGQSKVPTILWFVLLLSMLLWAYVSSSRELKAKILELEDVLSRNEVRVIRVLSQEMIEFEEVDDEGACYAFQVSDGEILFVSGQDYHRSVRFPNTDFSLNQIRNHSGRLIEELISKDGE